MRGSRNAASALFTLSAAAILVALAGGTTPLRGVAGEDKYPHGCADCHTGDETVIAMIDVLGHMSVEDRVRVVPDDCAACHDEGTMAGMDVVAHITHYSNPAENTFISDYGGACQHCHVLDAETGKVAAKSGPANW